MTVLALTISSGTQMLPGRFWRGITTQSFPLVAVLSRRKPFFIHPKSIKGLHVEVPDKQKYEGNAGNSNCGRPSVETLCSKWSQIYENSDIPDPVDSAQLIIAHAFGKKMIHEVPPGVEVDEEMVKTIDTLCRQRLDRKPVQYIIGEWDFIDLTLVVKPPILIPRPETEELCELIRKEMAHEGRETTPLRFLDLGCGSGAISLYLLKHLPQATCIAVDKSPEACDLTQENANRLSLDGRLTVLHGDIMQDWFIGQLSKAGQFDVIVSNPPYISTEGMETLMPEVKEYESHDALHGGKDGMDVVRKILNIAAEQLKAKGCVWLETDITHPVKIQDLVSNCPDLELEFAGIFEDFTKRPRFCKLQKL